MLDDISFRYSNAPNGFQLHGVKLEVRAGEVVALVGPSGAGKTTLANLVPRFYDVTSGAVRIDGKDVRDLQLASLREKIGMVAQETFLFNDTVANNIRYGKPKAKDDEIRAAARNAMAEEFIERMAARLRHHDRRARRKTERRPAAAAGHRAGVAQECADPDSG